MERKRAYIISEIWWNELRFNAKMMVHIFLVLVLLHSVVFIALSHMILGAKMSLTRLYAVAYVAQAFSLNPSLDVSVYGRKFELPASAILKSTEAGRIAKTQIPYLLALFIITLPIYGLALPVLKILKNKARKLDDREYISGARLVDEKELDVMIKTDGFDQRIPIAGIGLPLEAETRHGICVATSGAGKTQLMLPMLQAIRKIGAKAIVHVPKGDYLAKFYDPDSDFIFNPLDQRCLGWTLFNEIKSVPDIQTVAASLIPPAIGGQQMDPFWNNAARDVFTGILHKLYNDGKTSNADIWKAVTSEAAEITRMLKSVQGGEAGYTYIQDKSGKQALGVLATMMQFTRAFEFMADADGSFCISDWLKNGQPGFIFVSNYEDIKDTLKPVLSLFIDLFGKRLLSLDENRQRRIFIMLDEFGSLQRLSSIVNLQLRARSFGGGVWIFIQDNGQIIKLYGRETAQSIINSANTHIIMSVPDNETSQYWANRFGKTEFWEYEMTASFGVEDNKDGGSLRKIRKIEDILKASELSNLPDLTGYVRIPRPLRTNGTPHDEGYPYARIKVPLTQIDDIAPPFCMKDTWDLKKIFEAQGEKNVLTNLLSTLQNKNHSELRSEETDREKTGDTEQERDFVVDFNDL